MNFEADFQLKYLILFLATGFLSGEITFLFDCISPVVSDSRFLSQFFKCLRLIFLAILFAVFKNFYNFGNFRFYMPIIFLCGFYIYRKTLAKIIAFFCGMLYNKIINSVKKRTHRRKKSNDLRKTKANSRRSNGIGGSSIVYIAGNNDIPDERYSRKRFKRKGIEGKNRNSSKRKFKRRTENQRVFR